MNVLLTLASASLLMVAPSLATANDQGAAAGAATGAVAGALVGGPVGAVIGAIVGGAAVGAATGPNEHVAAVSNEPPAPLAADRVLLRPQSTPGTRLRHEPETTGGVVETTCVRDRRGNAKCRHQVVR
jgi:hypothetical protein